MDRKEPIIPPTLVQFFFPPINTIKAYLWFPSGIYTIWIKFLNFGAHIRTCVYSKFPFSSLKLHGKNKNNRYIIFFNIIVET